MTRDLRLDRLPPTKVAALRQLAGGLTYTPDRGFEPGYPSPSGDGRLPINSATIVWFVSVGWAVRRGDRAEITRAGREVLATVEQMGRAS